MFIFQLQSSELLFIVFILVPLTNVSCFLYTCASVATAVQVFVASAVLLGTTGLVPNVLVQLIVWFPVTNTGAAPASFSVLLFDPKTTAFPLVTLDGNVNASCFHDIVVAYQSYVDTLFAVIPELRASSCACVNGVSFTVY